MLIFFEDDGLDQVEAVIQQPQFLLVRQEQELLFGCVEVEEVDVVFRLVQVGLQEVQEFELAEGLALVEERQSVPHQHVGSINCVKFLEFDQIVVQHQ